MTFWHPPRPLDGDYIDLAAPLGSWKDDWPKTPPKMDEIMAAFGPIPTECTPLFASVKWIKRP